MAMVPCFYLNHPRVSTIGCISPIEDLKQHFFVRWSEKNKRMMLTKSKQSSLVVGIIKIVRCTTCTFHKYRPQNYKQSSRLILLAELWMSFVCGHSGIIKYTLHYYIQLTCSTLSSVGNKKRLTHCTLATFFIRKSRVRNKSCLLLLTKPNLCI